MARNDRRFARVYYDDLRRDYPEVWKDNDALSTWLRLLVVADIAWPTTPDLPRHVKARPLEMLADSGLIALGPDDTFAVKGYDADRSKRHANAVAAAGARGAPSAVPDGAPSADPTQTRPDQTSSPPPQVGRRVNGTNPRATGTNPRAQGTSPRQEREKEKRGPSALHEILTSIQTKGKGMTDDTDRLDAPREATR